MNKIKLFTHYVELFLLSMIFLIFTGLVLVRMTVLNRNFVASCFSTSHYKEVEEALKKEMKHSMISSGIRSEVIDTMFTKEDIQKTTSRTLDILYNDYRLHFEHSDIEKRLRENIQNDLKEQNFTSNDESGLNHFVKSIMKIYEAEFHMLNHVSSLGKIIQLVTPFVDVLCYLCGGILLLWMIFRRRYLTQILSVPFFTSGMLILFGIYYVSTRTEIRHFTMFSLTFSKIVRRIILETFTVFNVVAVTFFFLGICVILLRRFPKKKQKKLVLTIEEQEEINRIEVPNIDQEWMKKTVEKKSSSKKKTTTNKKTSNKTTSSKYATKKSKK